MKSFALKQIETCCKDMRDLDQPLVGVIITGEQWMEREIAAAESALADARESREREIELTDARNKWIRDLRESLERSCG